MLQRGVQLPFDIQLLLHQQTSESHSPVNHTQWQAFISTLLFSL